MTMDDVIILTSEKKELLNPSSNVKMTAKEAKQTGVKMPQNTFGGKSLVQIIKAQRAEKQALEQLKSELDEALILEREAHDKENPDIDFKPSGRWKRQEKRYQKRASKLDAEWVTLPQVQIDFKRNDET